MRKTLLATALAVLMSVGSVVAPGPASARSGALSGTWTSTDTDGSSQTLTIRGSGLGAYSMFLFDSSATNACGGAPASVVGQGLTDADTLLLVGTLVCLPGGNVLRSRLTFGFTYAAGPDTLTDETGVVWRRS